MPRMESGRAWMHAGDFGFRLDKGDGGRSATKTITFGRSFQSPPQVVVALTKIDIDKDRNARIHVEATSVGASGFIITFKTWADTVVYGVEASWLAYGD